MSRSVAHFNGSSYLLFNFRALQTSSRTSGRFWLCATPCRGGFQGTAFKDGLVTVFGLAAAGTVQFCLRNPRILYKHAWYCISYLQTQLCWVFSARGGSTFLCVFRSTRFPNLWKAGGEGTFLAYSLA